MHLFAELVDEGYIAMNSYLRRPGDDGLPWSEAWLQSLIRKGLIEIGKHPRPDEEFAHMFESATEEVKDNDERRDWIAWLDRGVTFLRSAQGLGDLMQRHWPWGT
jgi:hypothetical protein